MNLKTFACAALTLILGSSAFSQAYATGEYPNLFTELLGKSEAEVRAKIDAAWKQLFYGNDATERVYYPSARTWPT